MLGVSWFCLSLLHLFCRSFSGFLGGKLHVRALVLLSVGFTINSIIFLLLQVVISESCVRIALVDVQSEK